jgi:hypothetical protein
MAAAQSKVLRLGVIQGGKIVEERLQTARQPVTIGTSARNTIVVPISDLPESFTAFTLAGDAYQLCFEEGMDGRVQDDQGSTDLATLVAQGRARREGKGHAMAVTESMRGRLTLGEVTLLWQFVNPPPEAPRPVLPPNARGNHFRSMDRLFATVLALSFLTHGGLYAALANTELPPEVTIEQIPDRYARLLVPDRHVAAPVEKKEEPRPVEEKKAEEKKPEGDGKKAEKKAESAEQVAARKAARAAAVAKAVQSKGMLKVLGALGPGSGGGAVSDVFGAGGGMTDVATALSGAGGVAVATDPGAGGGRKGGGQGGAAPAAVRSGTAASRRSR